MRGDKGRVENSGDAILIYKVSKITFKNIQLCNSSENEKFWK